MARCAPFTHRGGLSVCQRVGSSRWDSGGVTEFSGRVWRAGKPVDVELDMAAISDYVAKD